MAVLRKLGLFGGSFDPPHAGHLLIALRALESCGLDRVLFIPCHQSPLKGAEASAGGSHRLRMVQLALKNVEWAAVTDVELQRKGPSYTVDTVREIRKSHPGAACSWIMGADQWNQLENWRDYPTLAAELDFIVYPREVEPVVRGGVRSIFLNFRYDLSSTEIRERIRQGLEIHSMVPESVIGYIRDNGLYP